MAIIPVTAKLKPLTLKCSTGDLCEWLALRCRPLPLTQLLHWDILEFTSPSHAFIRCHRLMVCHLIVAINAYRGNVYNEHVLKVGLVSLCLGLFLQSFDCLVLFGLTFLLQHRCCTRHQNWLPCSTLTGLWSKEVGKTVVFWDGVAI